jgi:hypothetical protein
MAAVLACGSDAALSHDSAAALWMIRKETGNEIHVSVPTESVLAAWASWCIAARR